MTMLKSKTPNILVGVTGGISAYKSASIVSALKKIGCNVNVIMTDHAQKFIAPLTLQTLSENPVICNMFEDTENPEVKHITLAEKADLILVAPATANIIAKVAHGIADDMLSTTILAATCPVIFCPAMNCNMYANSIVQENIAKLKSHNYMFVEPTEGHLACGTEGVGKLADTVTIIKKVKEYL